MRPLLLSLLFAASVLHAATSSMTVSMESKGVSKTEFRSGTNAVLVAAKAAIPSTAGALDTATTNALINTLQSAKLFSLYYNSTQLDPRRSSPYVLSKTSVSTVSLSILAGSFGCNCVFDIFTTHASAKLTVSPDCVPNPTTMQQLTISCSGLSSSGNVDFILRVTYTPTSGWSSERGDGPLTPNSVVRLYYLRNNFSASLAL